MNLPKFTAEMALYRTKRVYLAGAASFEQSAGRLGWPNSGNEEVVPALPNCPPGLAGNPPNCYISGLGNNTCANRCAVSCQNVQTQEDYQFCYNQCVDAACEGQPGTGGGPCVAPPGSCNPARYCACLNEAANVPGGAGNCRLLYGPPSYSLGTACCSGVNANLKTNSANCGACGHECSAETFCCGGTCCLSGSCCNEICSNLQTDNNNCGTCGNECFGGQTCQSGTCACPSANPDWCNACTNLQTDPFNCGSCGTECPIPANSTQTCVNGACGFICNSGLIQSGNGCCPFGQTFFDGCCITGTPPILSGGNASVCGNGNFTLFSPAPGNGCQPVGDLDVSFAVTSDLFATAAAGPCFGLSKDCSVAFHEGFTVQLNAFNQTRVMQYVFVIASNQIEAQVFYSASGNGTINNSTANNFTSGNILSSSQDSFHLPANFLLDINLKTDGSGNVTTAIFNVTDNSGKTSTKTVNLSALSFPLVPILGFQVDIVGPDGCTASTFLSGAGAVTYNAANGLCVTGSVPTACGISNTVNWHG